MTNVVIHGILAKKFGTSIKLKVGNFKFLVLAIDSIKNGFREEIVNLHKEGSGYEIIFNENQIDLIPIIAGSGSTFYKVLGIILQVIGIIVGFFLPVVGMLISGIGSALYAYGSKLDAIKKMEEYFQKIAEQQKGKGAGGATKLVGGIGKSYFFENANMANQGGTVMIGYGKMRAGSNIISTSMKHNPTNISFQEESSYIDNSILNLYD